VKCISKFVQETDFDFNFAVDFGFLWWISVYSVDFVWAMDFDLVSM